VPVLRRPAYAPGTGTPRRPFSFTLKAPHNAIASPVELCATTFVRCVRAIVGPLSPETLSPDVVPITVDGSRLITPVWHGPGAGLALAGEVLAPATTTAS
jgi:hypothetical protein